MADQKTRLVLSDFSGGRNAVDSPLGPSFGSNQVTDAVNGDWFHTSGFRRRHGSSALSMGGSPMLGIVSFLGRHVPGTSEGDAELWALDATAPSDIVRLKNSTTWASVNYTNGPAIGSHTWDFTSASLNGKFFIAYPNAPNRLNTYDPLTATLRSTGITPGSNPPTVINDGSGSYSNTLQYWRVRWALAAGGIYRVVSEPTPSAPITPSGSGSGVQIFHPARPFECENVWIVEVSTDNTTFYVINAIDINTASYINTLDASSWPALNVSPLSGTYSLQMPYRFIAADDNRLIGFGSFDTTDPQHRLEWSAIVGTSVLFNGSPAVGAEERVDTTIQSFRDLDENDSGVPSALIGPIWGNFYPFKTRQMWEAVPTGSTDEPYRISAISKELGCVGPHAVVRGEDGVGNPCLYFLSHRGVYRYGARGMEYIGVGVEDYILGPTATLNLQAANVVGHMLYHQDKRQVWVWFATGTSNDPNTLFIFDVRANGGNGAWARVVGSLASARCSVMFADHIGATMGVPLVPYIGDATTVNTVVKCDNSTVTDDRGVNFEAYVTTRPLEVPGYVVETADVLVLAPSANNVSLAVTMTPDFGAQPDQAGTVDLSPVGTETRLSRRAEGTAVTGAQFIQARVGDHTGADLAWSFDRLTIPIAKAEPLS